MAKTAPVDQKRKPPTFQHLPEQRAKKLKKLWVEKQKIKSKWKAQKRKEGIVTARDALSSTKTAQAEDDVSVGEAKEESDAGATSESEPEPTLPPPQKRQKTSKPTVEEEAEKLSLRELQRQAYSPASLHHYKSDPLHRHRGRESNTGNRGGRGGSGGRGRGFRGGGGMSSGGHGRGRGGGQPDMRLRMSVMLDKIKRSMA